MTGRVEDRPVLIGGGWSFPALAVAALWSIALLVGAATLPAYRSTTVSGTGMPGGAVRESTSTATLIEVNGSSVLLVVGIPLAAVTVVSVLLLWRRRHRKSGAGALAWVVVGLLGGVAFLGMLTIGIFLMPAVGLLGLACATAPTAPHRAHLPPPPVGRRSSM